MKRLLLLIAAIALVAADTACGSNPGGPTPPSIAQLSGNWVGVMSYTQLSNGTPVSRAENVTIALSQAGGSVTGTWSTAVRNGSINGTVTPTDFSGTFTYNATSSTGAACIGTLNVRGDAGADRMTWTSPTVVENCSGQPENITFALRR